MSLCPESCWKGYMGLCPLIQNTAGVAMPFAVSHLKSSQHSLMVVGSARHNIARGHSVTARPPLSLSCCLHRELIRWLLLLARIQRATLMRSKLVITRLTVEAPPCEHRGILRACKKTVNHNAKSDSSVSLVWNERRQTER
jgi:hypothetical protein